MSYWEDEASMSYHSNSAEGSGHLYYWGEKSVEEYAYWHRDEFGTVVARTSLDARPVISVQFVPDKPRREANSHPTPKIRQRELEAA